MRPSSASRPASCFSACFARFESSAISAVRDAELLRIVASSPRSRFCAVRASARRCSAACSRARIVRRVSSNVRSRSAALRAAVPASAIALVCASLSFRSVPSTTMMTALPSARTWYSASVKNVTIKRPYSPPRRRKGTASTLRITPLPTATDRAIASTSAPATSTNRRVGRSRRNVVKVGALPPCTVMTVVSAASWTNSCVSTLVTCGVAASKPGCMGRAMSTVNVSAATR